VAEDFVKSVSYLGKPTLEDKAISFLENFTRYYENKQENEQV